jgi:hypothetical protein
MLHSEGMSSVATLTKIRPIVDSQELRAQTRLYVHANRRGDSALGQEIVHQLAEREELIVSPLSPASSVFIDLTAPDLLTVIPDDVISVIACAAQMPHSTAPTSSYLEINALGPVAVQKLVLQGN